MTTNEGGIPNKLEDKFLSRADRKISTSAEVKESVEIRIIPNRCQNEPSDATHEPVGEYREGKLEKMPKHNGVSIIEHKEEDKDWEW
ncbi:31_t:CDS:2 [Funneliformis geosporum]|nr:31_t:CDS:2 [Funneliformis geosporum]